MKIYLASPMVTEEQLKRNLEIADKIESINGIELILPQRDLDQDDPRIVDKCFEAVRNCDMIITINVDTRGLWAETGYAYALGKKIWILEVPESRKLKEKDMGARMAEKIFNNIDDMVDEMRK